MIKNSRQSWTPGQPVRVGFLALVVLAAIPTPGDGAPDAYILSNAAGDKLYKFVPHCGLESISIEDAQELLAAAQRHAARIAAQIAGQAARAARVRQLLSVVQS